MIYEPIWKIKSQHTDFPSLKQDLKVDIAIIGGGITGVTIAHLLKQRGVKTVLLESRKIGEGTTGQSTGNLYELTEYAMDEMKKKYDMDTVKKVIQSRKEAMGLIAENIKELQIDCDFERQPMYLFENDVSEHIDKEEALAKELKLDFSSLSGKNFPLPFEKGLAFKDQAHFNPLKYVQELAQHCHGENCAFYENSRVVEIEDKKDAVILKTDNAKVEAKKAVHATHTPIGLQLQYHTTLGAYREYGVAAKLKTSSYPKGIYWGYFKERKYSIRTYSPEGDPYLIGVGSMHKVGEAENNYKHIEELIDFLKTHFDVEKITHRWGGQNYKPADLLPYIGKKNYGSNQYIATGFSTDGLVYGSLAAMILSDDLTGKTNEYSALYKASRHHPMKASEKFAKENFDMVKKLIGDAIKKGAETQSEDLLPGEGKLIELDDGKFAVYRKADGELKILSPTCPHMGCTVQWNAAEKSWDCPCHGSRFDTSGAVIEGPSYDGLEQV